MSAEVPEDFVDLQRCLHDERCELTRHVYFERSRRSVTLWRRMESARPICRRPAPSIKWDCRPFVSTSLPRSRVGYEEATRDAIEGHLGSERVRFIGLEAMVHNKRATARTKDLADAEALEEIRRRQLRR